MNNRVLPHIAGLATISVWGMTFVCTKILLQYLTPLDILLTRTVLGFLALWAFRPRMLKLDKRSHELLFAAAGFAGVFGYYLFENTALVYADASVVSVVTATAPLFTAGLGFLVLRESGFGVRFLIGFVIAISGIALISFQGEVAHAGALGVVLSLMGAMIWAVYSVIVRHLSNVGYETIAMTKRIFAWGLVFLVLSRVVAGGDYPFESLLDPVVFGNLAFLGLLASAGGFITWGYSVKHLGPAAASAYIYLQVPITVLWAMVLLGESLNGVMIVGIVMVLVGLALSEGFDKRLIDFVRMRIGSGSDIELNGKRGKGRGSS